MQKVHSPFLGTKKLKDGSYEMGRNTHSLPQKMDID
jgi:hypothetical protein